ncbi:MAG: ABC transporter permease [Promethearchaeota archaeon]
MQAYLQNARNSLRTWSIYLGGLISDLLAYPLEIIVFYLLWAFIYDAADTKTIVEITFTAMIAYVVMQRLFQRIIETTDIAREIENEINEGAISIYICRPINHQLLKISAVLPRTLITVIISFLSVIILFPFFGLPGLANPVYLLWIIFALSISILSSLLINLILGYVTFWTKESPWWFYYAPLRLIGGGLVPLTLFPKWITTILIFLPFSLIYYFPLAFLVIPETIPIEEVTYVLVSCFWLVILSFGTTIMWKRGLYRFDAQGG